MRKIRPITPIPACAESEIHDYDDTDVDQPPAQKSSPHHQKKEKATFPVLSGLQEMEARIDWSKFELQEDQIVFLTSERSQRTEFTQPVAAAEHITIELDGVRYSVPE